MRNSRKFFYIMMLGVAATVVACVGVNNEEAVGKPTTTAGIINGAAGYSMSRHALIYDSAKKDIDCGSTKGGNAPCTAVVPGPSKDGFITGASCNDPTAGKCKLDVNLDKCTSSVVAGSPTFTCASVKFCANKDECDDSDVATIDECLNVGQTFGICYNHGATCSDGLGVCKVTGVLQGSVCSVKALPPTGGELCGDLLDNDCDGLTDEENAAGCSTFYTDADVDTYGTAVSKCLCSGASPFTATKAGDCNDSDKIVFPSAPELCDGKDNDCNGKTDESFVTKGAVCDGPDADLCANGKFACNVAGTGVDCVGDANLSEVCDGLDNDCNGKTDEGCDDDGDGWCDANILVLGKPSVCSKGTGDCNDTNAAVNPGVIELCNAVDDNCNGATDETFTLGGACKKNAGKGVCEANGIVFCASNGTATCNAPDIVGTAEVCDDIDNDCDGVTDNGCDDDGDGWCDKAMTVVGAPKVCSKGKDDCVDTQKTVYPGAAEVCDGLDNDCDSAVDEGLDTKTTCGNGVCSVTVTDCVAGKSVVCAPDMTKKAAEVCDGLDNDCNGQIDDPSPNLCQSMSSASKLACGGSITIDTAKDLNAGNVFAAWQTPISVGDIATPGKEELIDLSGIPLGKKFKLSCSPLTTSKAQYFGFLVLLLKGNWATPDLDTNKDGTKETGSTAMVSEAGFKFVSGGVGGINLWAVVDVFGATDILTATCSVACQ